MIGKKYFSIQQLTGACKFMEIKYYVLFIFFIFHLAVEFSVSIEVEVSDR